ncbi:hypothetical protein C8R47DRAFT_90474 [Mycena vitilis]|nr:hypothetical protein C8R47DRAFT_90474 [Mycena vitilis]
MESTWHSEYKWMRNQLGVPCAQAVLSRWRCPLRPRLWARLRRPDTTLPSMAHVVLGKESEPLAHATLSTSIFAALRGLDLPLRFLATFGEQVENVHFLRVSTPFVNGSARKQLSDVGVVARKGRILVRTEPAEPDDQCCFTDVSRLSLQGTGSGQSEWGHIHSPPHDGAVGECGVDLPWIPSFDIGSLSSAFLSKSTSWVSLVPACVTLVFLTLQPSGDLEATTDLDMTVWARSVAFEIRPRWVGWRFGPVFSVFAAKRGHCR